MLSYKYTYFKMSNYKHFSKMYILVRVIALLFHCDLSVWLAFRTKSVKFSGESQSRSSCTSDSKIEFFYDFLTFTDGEYTCEMQVMHLGIEPIAQTAPLCQRHTQPFCQSRFILKDLSLLIHANLLTFNHMIAKFVYAVNIHVL